MPPVRSLLANNFVVKLASCCEGACAVAVDHGSGRTHLPAELALSCASEREKRNERAVEVQSLVHVSLVLRWEVVFNISGVRFHNPPGRCVLAVLLAGAVWFAFFDHSWTLNHSNLSVWLILTGVVGLVLFDHFWLPQIHSNPSVWLILDKIGQRWGCFLTT